MQSKAISLFDIVKSLAGHDGGLYMLVIATDGDDLVLVADGRTRKLASPKRKKRKHVQKVAEVSDELLSRLKSGLLTDAELNKYLKQFKNNDGGDLSPCQKTM